MPTNPKLNAALDAGVADFVGYVVGLARNLVDMGITPLLVLDGKALLAKRATEADRLQ